MIIQVPRSRASRRTSRPPRTPTPEASAAPTRQPTPTTSGSSGSTTRPARRSSPTSRSASRDLLLRPVSVAAGQHQRAARRPRDPRRLRRARRHRVLRPARAPAAPARHGPLLYPLGALTVAYALSVGNAGTGFRYRSHLVTLGLAIVVVLREYCLSPAAQPAPAARRPPGPPRGAPGRPGGRDPPGLPPGRNG